MKAACYIRVSTREQLEGYSILAQKRQLTAYCESQGWDVVGYFVEEGKSAKDTNRPELQRMMKQIENGLIDCVLVYKLDRLTRSVMDLYNLLETFDKNGCHFKSATEVYDTTSAMGKLFMTLVASFAQFERDQLSERVSMGMEEMAREGKWKGGAIGYGHDKKDDTYIIIEEEAEVIRMMYDWYLKEGLGDRAIAIRLNDMGIKTRLDHEWSEQKIRYVLTNKKNIGIYEYGVRTNQDKAFEIENIYPPIIDQEIFYKAYRVRETRRNQNGKAATSSYYFSGIMRCPKCGNHFKGTKSRGIKRYICIGRSHKNCDMPSITEEYVDKQFEKELKNFAKRKLKIQPAQASGTDRRQLKRINKEIDQIKKRRTKWQYAWANDVISEQEFQERMQEEQLKEDELTRKKLELNIEDDRQEIDHLIIEAIQEQATLWKNMSEQEKKQFIQIFFKSIIIEIDTSIKTEDKVTFKRIEFN